MRLRVSWSANGAAAEARVRDVLGAAGIAGLEASFRPGRFSQFEHLRALVREAEGAETPPAWVFFSDDDDIWSERRHEQFVRACADAAAATSVLCSTRKARPARAGAPPPVATAAEARAALATGALGLTDLRRHDVTVESFHMAEYFDYAVRLDALSGFVRDVPAAVLRHKLCDLAFASKLRKLRPKLFTPEDDDFVYYYSRPEGQPFALNGAGVPGEAEAGASTGVELGGREAELARAGLRAAAEALGPEHALDQSTLAFFLAAVRQGVEQELVQLRVASARPKPRETDAVCERQLDLLLADHPARGTPRLARFRGWALGVLATAGSILQGLLRRLQFDPLRGGGR